MMQKVWLQSPSSAASFTTLCSRRFLSTAGGSSCSSTSSQKSSKASTDAAASSDEPDMADQIERDLIDAAPPLSSIDDNRVPMPSVMKEIFVGRFPTAILSYPDVLPKDRYLSLEARCRQAQQTISNKKELIDSIEEEGRVPKDVLLALRSQGFYGLNSPISEGGEGLSVTETCKLMEELSVEMSLSETVATAANIGCKAIQLWGTPSFKAERLRKFVEGSETLTLAMADSGAGSDASASTTIAVSDEDGSFSLTGKKLWVTNADTADHFVVLANALVKHSETGTTNPLLTAFVVPKTAPGLTVLKDERHRTVGMKGLQIAPVELKGVTVNANQMLGSLGQGFEVLTSVLSVDRVVSCARISAALRGFLSSTIRHALARKTFGKKLLEFELIQLRLGEAAATLYALESMVYMTAGIADNQTDVDISMESAACKRFAVRSVKIITDHCLSVLGSRGYLESDPHRRCANDLMAYSLWDSTDDILSMYIAVTGIGVAGANLGENVRKVRNPLVHPIESLVLRYKTGTLAQKKQKFKRTLELSDYLHPSLTNEGNILEYYVHKLSQQVFNHLIKEGANASLREIQLSRLSDCAVTIFAMASSLARASRAFSEGYEHSYFDVDLAKTVVAANETKMDSDFDLLKANKYSECNDVLFGNIADYLTHRGMYPATHPMKKFDF